MVYRLGLCVVILTLSIFILLSTNEPKAVKAKTDDCSKVKIIYGRGSGQKVGSSTEFESFKRSLYQYGISSDEIIEIDSSTMPNDNDKSYPAVDILNLEGVSAVVSRGKIGAYSSSLAKGEDLLIQYITTSNFLECGTKLVLAGYSQGAQVISKAISNPRLKNYYPQISFIATFGDPSLDLNTLLGGDIFAKTPWYRGSAVKYISGGLVNVRNPYLPPELENKSGAWCDVDDIICTGNVLKFLNELVNRPHSSYPKKAIPDAAREIVAKLKEDAKISFTGPTCGALKQDIVLAVNLSPSVRTDSEFLSDKGIEKTVKGVFESGCNVRVAMVEFGRKGIDPTRPVLDFTDDPAVLTNLLKTYRTGNETTFQIEKANVSGAISLAMDFQWDEGAQKAVVVMSDAPDDNFVLSGSGIFDGQASLNIPEMQKIIRKSSEKGGVEIHAARIYHNDRQPFVLDGPTSFYSYMSELVTRTAGSFTDKGSCNFCSWQNMSFDLKSKLASKPNVSVQTIRIKQGQSVELTAKDVSGGVIPQNNRPSYPMSYTWYTDCQSLGSPTGYGATTSVTPSGVGTCYGAVLARGSSPAFCNICYEGDPYSVRAVTPFLIEVLPADYRPPPAPSVVRNVTKERLWDDDTIRIKWDPPENADQVGEIAYIIRDSDGNVLGATRSTQLHIIEVADTDNPIVTVSAVSEGGSGESSSIRNALETSRPQPSGSAVQTGVPSSGGPNPTTTNVASVAVPGNTSGVISVATQQLGTIDRQQKVLSAISPLNQKSDISGFSQPKAQSSWLSLTIWAVPIAIAVALGLIVRYGMLLQLNKK